MKTSILTLSLVLIISCSPKQEVYEDAFCITNVTTIDAQSGQQDGMTVIVKDNRIVKVAKAENFNLAPSNQIIDGTGKYLIPGLWDAHVHFAYIEELAPSMFDLFLAYGITSVRDTGGKLDFVKDWKNRAVAAPKDAPRVMIAGPLLDGSPNVYDGSDPSRPPLSLGADGVDDAIALVDMFDSVGVDLIKAYEMLTPEQFTAVTQRAREKGLKVTGHVPLSMDVSSASNAGLNSMEHMRNLEMSCASNWEELLEKRKQMLFDGKKEIGGILRSSIHAAQRSEAVDNYDEETANNVLAVLAENETWQIPTIALSTGSLNRHFAREDFTESFKYLPTAIAESWMEGASILSEMTIPESRLKHPKWMMKMIKKVNDAEIDIMAGTDCPIFYLTPGLSLHEELATLVKAGLTPMDALEAATLNPARYFNMENELGLINEGYLADLVLLDANPLEDINNTKKISMVVKDGKFRSSSDLDQLFQKLAAQ
ncbi:MAG: amidohydrolase family protein [Cyclobacteriaceae bacterium]